jgi:hypothetical protein
MSIYTFFRAYVAALEVPAGALALALSIVSFTTAAMLSRVIAYGAAPRAVRVDSCMPVALFERLYGYL